MEPHLDAEMELHILHLRGNRHNFNTFIEANLSGLNYPPEIVQEEVVEEDGEEEEEDLEEEEEDLP
jgi:hypothetical protein